MNEYQFEKVIRDDSNLGHEEEASLHALSSTTACSPSATPVSKTSGKTALRRSVSGKRHMNASCVPKA